MKKSEIKVGQRYQAKVSGKLTTVRVDRIYEQTTFGGKASTSYDVTNLTTGRETKFRSAAKFRKAIRWENAAEMDAWLLAQPAAAELTADTKQHAVGDDEYTPGRLRDNCVCDRCLTIRVIKRQAAKTQAT